MDVAKQYAARNRQGSEWFSHDANKNEATAEGNGHKLDVIQESTSQSSGNTEAPAVAVVVPAVETHAVEHVASPAPVELTKSDVLATPSSQSTTFDQPSTPVSTPLKGESVVSPPGSSSRAQMIKPTCDSNQWYKFDQGDNGNRTRQQPTGKKTRPVSQPVDWFSHDGTKQSNIGAEGKVRVTDQDGASYRQRDKMGSSGAWFGHGAGGEATSVGPRVTTREGAVNANRMRGESENWFNHSGNAGAAREPVHVSKGRAGYQSQSNDMHNIFHHGN